MKKIIYNNSLLFSLLWAFVIFILCATPGAYIPSFHLLDLLSFDKWVHASMFFILSCLLLLSVIKYNKSNTAIFVVFIACVLYGGSLEIMQAKFFSNRSADWSDFAANSFGCIVAILLLKKLRKYFTGNKDARHKDTRNKTG